MSGIMCNIFKWRKTYKWRKMCDYAWSFHEIFYRLQLQFQAYVIILYIVYTKAICQSRQRQYVLTTTTITQQQQS